MKVIKDDFSTFFTKNKQEIYFTNIKTISLLSIIYMSVLFFFAIIAIHNFSYIPERLVPLLITYVTMFLLMVVMYIFSRYIHVKQIKDLKLSIFMTYLSMFLTMAFIILISVFIARPSVRASFFLLFNILLPSLYMLRKREIVTAEVIYAVIFIILSFIFRREAFSSDLYLAISSLLIGIPYNLMIYQIKINDSFTKKLYLDQAYLDTLSGLPNRRAFNSKLETMYNNIEYDSVVLAIIDLDDFKSLNDSKGHAYGDYAIKEVGAALKKFAEEYQFFVSRIGGDEFILIGLNVQLVKLSKTLDELLEMVRSVKLKDDDKIELSIGAFYSNAPYKYNTEEIFIKADEALYFVKENNKGEINLVIDE
ncbi:MAG TPA: diguanylate cyclase [Acholeplasmataceae bacterium]|nr:diguanylate cyclase [Acholeplasmataceae bacterium]